MKYYQLFIFLLFATVFSACVEDENVEEIAIQGFDNVEAATVDAGELPSVALSYIYENFEGELVVSALSFESTSGTSVFEADLTNNLNLTFEESGELLDFDEPSASCDGKMKKRRGGKKGRGSKPDSVDIPETSMELAFEDLPENAQTYLIENYPDSEYLKIKSKEDSAGLAIYKVLVSEIGAIVFDAEGEFVGLNERGGRECSTFVELAFADLPEAVASYISENYPEAVFTKAKEVTKDGTLSIYVHLEDIGVLIFDESGTFQELHTCGN